MKQPFCTPAQALRRVLDAAANLPVPATERVPLDDACGRIAARDLCARMDQGKLLRLITGFLDQRCLKGMENHTQGRGAGRSLGVVLIRLPVDMLL